MIVLTTAKELRNVLECIAPDYPRPYLEGIEEGSGQCTYVCNGEQVTLILNDIWKMEDNLK